MKNNTIILSVVLGTLIMTTLFYSCKKELSNTNSTSTIVIKQEPIITTNAATFEIEITSDAGTNITARGLCWNTKSNPTISDNKTSDGIGVGKFNSIISGLIPNTIYFVRPYVTNSNETSYGSEISFKTALYNGTVTDIDGNVYHTIIIGSQEWIVENLRTTRFAWGKIIPLVSDNTEWDNLSTPGYCWYNNDTTNKKTLGAIYNWYAANSLTIEGGWHLPNDEDINRLVGYCGGQGVVGGKLKESGTANWESPNSGATNEYGFTAIPAGLRSFKDGNFYNWGKIAHFWQWGEESPTSGYYFDLYNTSPRCIRGYGPKPIGGSARLVRNALISPPTVRTAVTTFGQTTAISGGNVLHEGDAPVIAKGVCFGTSRSCTVADNKTVDGAGPGSFTSNISGLSTDPLLYFRAYATNIYGTGYGDPIASTYPTIIVGLSYQGGIIGYIFKNGDPGFIAGETHGLIVASTYYAGSAEWGCSGASVGVTLPEIGAGLQNTKKIIATCGNKDIAARYCTDLKIDGYGDWFLPSEGEINAIYWNREKAGWGYDFYCWSSSQKDNSNALQFQSNHFTSMPKNSKTGVLAIRYF